MKARGVGILGIGTCLPDQRRTNEYWDGKLANRRGEADILDLEKNHAGGRIDLPSHVRDAMALLRDDPYRGARVRYVLPDGADPSDLEAEAARRAMRDASVRPDEIDFVLVHALVPDQICPGNANAVQHKCELTNATALTVDAACASLMLELATAAALVRSGMYRNVLVVCSAVWSRMLDYTVPQSLSFGDGAAAAVVGAVPSEYGIIGNWARTDGALRGAVVLAPVVEGRPIQRWDTAAAPIRLTSFDVAMGKSLGVNGPDFCRDACTRALDTAGIGFDAVDLFLGAQTLGWFPDACRRAMGLPAEKCFHTFAEIGNVGAAAVLFNLQRAHDEARLRDGDVVLMYSPGGGFTRASIVYRWCEKRS